MKTLWLSLAITLLFSSDFIAQIKMDVGFDRLLKELELAFNEPTENRYKTINRSNNNFYNCDFSIKCKNDDLEIRYSIFRIYETESEVIFPHILSMNTVHHLASNQNDSEIVVHSVPEETLKNQFNADWAAVFYFTPKSQFSSKRNCKLLVIYKEGKGLVYTFFLFNNPSIELDHQFYSLSFDK